MSRWLEKQLKYYIELTLSKTGTYVVRTNDIALSNLLNRPDYRETIQKDIAKKVDRGFDFGEFLIKELIKEYKKITGRESEWNISGHCPGMEGDWEAWVYLLPTTEEVNFKLKTKKWLWSRELEGVGVKTGRRWLHIGHFSPKSWNPRVFIRVEKLNKEG